MPAQTWILDPSTGTLVVEGLEPAVAVALAGDLLATPLDLNCARPIADILPLVSQETASETRLRVARLYHGSVVDGPGRRSVVQLQGCPIRCPGCYVPETHDSEAGLPMEVADVVAAILAPEGVPRDGVSVLGGEPFLQLDGLLHLLRQLKARHLHVVTYTGYTLEALARRPEPAVRQSLDLVDLLVDGPFVAGLADGAGEWRGSRNQRFIPQPGARLRKLAATAESPGPS